MRRLSSVIPILALAAVPVLAAQEAGDTLPFRAHQWAFLFTGGSSFAGIGGLHFTAPNRAWVLNLSASFTHDRASSTPFPDTTIVTTGNFFSLSGRLGRRFYEPVRHDVAAYQTLGILAGGSRGCSSSNFAPIGSSCAATWSAGFFGELGAQYFLTPRISIGGQVSAALTGFYQHTSGLGSPNNWEIALTVGTVSFGGGIYF